jgi:hypothetical protein
MSSFPNRRLFFRRARQTSNHFPLFLAQLAPRQQSSFSATGTAALKIHLVVIPRWYLASLVEPLEIPGASKRAVYLNQIIV